MRGLTIVTLLAVISAACGSALAGPSPDKGRLLMTAGVGAVEGQAGGGLSPWALIAGYGTEDSWGLAVHGTYIALPDYSLTGASLAVGIKNRLELSVSQQRFDTEDVGAALGLGQGFAFGQTIYGAKLRVLGDAVYGQDSAMPQVTIGVQHKRAEKGGVLAAVGAADDEGTDFLVTATKLSLAKRLLLSGTVRATKANQFGLLGFGSAGDDGYGVEAEGAAALLLSRRAVVGVEYRSKPDNLAFAEENDAASLFAAYFPSKHVSVTAALVDLGSIAGQDEQRGFYLSLQTGF